MPDREYTYEKDFKGKTPKQIVKIIEAYHDDDEQLFGAAFDIVKLNL